MHPLHRRIGALCGGVPHHFHRLIITTAPSCVLQVHTRVRQVSSKKRSAKAGGARRSQERGPGWSEPRDTRAAIAAPWVAVEGFGTMDLKVTAFDAVLYEGASRGIPTTKLHSMYSRKLAAGAAVGAGHSNLYVCALPRDIDVRHIAPTSATHRAHSAHVDAMRDVLTQQATQINELAQHNHNSIISFQKRTRQNA